MGMLIGPAGGRTGGRALTKLIAGAAACMLSAAVCARQDPAPGASPAPSAARFVPLPAHVHRLAQPRSDIGEAPGSLQMSGLELVLARTAAQNKALDALLTAQHDAKSPQYHHWLTPAQFGARFGASAATVAALTQWLGANGFRVDELPASRSWLQFHGSRAQVEAALHTQIHLFDVEGRKHFANVTDPEVPAELAPLIAAIRGLHDFYPRANVQRVKSPRPLTTYGGQQYVGPADVATIYNLSPLYQQGIKGSGVTIAIGGQSDINPAMATAFWTGFGLSTPSFNSMTVPGGTDPGQTNDNNELEAYLDVETAGALAQGAKIILVRDTDVFNAAQYVINSNLAAILSLSFGDCESDQGSNNTSINSLFQQAVAQGITITVSSGDNGVAGCESNTFTQGTLASTGFAVNALASTPYDLAVGGTDFDPTLSGDWASSNGAGLATALAHIPEMVWNDSCANPLWVKALGQTNTGTFCNTTTLKGQPNPYLEVAGGSGGLSSCAVQLTGGTCAGYSKPAWQGSVAATQSFGARAIPDVALLANNWIICSQYDTVCAPAAPNAPATGNVDLVRGTSIGAPTAAAIVALLDSAMSTTAVPDGRQGLINTQLYNLAASEYGTPLAPNGTASACSASLGSTVGSGCIFYNVIAGTDDQPCQVSGYSGGQSTCAAPAGQPNGIIEIDSLPQYEAGTGFNLAAGLGSLNAANLVLAIYLPAPSGLAATSAGQAVNLTWAAEPNATSFNVYQGSMPAQEGSAPVLTGATGTTATVPGLQFGQTYYFTIGAVAPLGASAKSNEAQATIVPAAPTGLAATASNGSVTLTWSAAAGAASYNVYQGTTPGGEAAQPVRNQISVTTVMINGLMNGTTYYYKVAAVDAGGVSAQSAEAQATPVAPSGGGGGALDVLDLLLLALLVAARLRSGVAAPGHR